MSKVYGGVCPACGDLEFVTLGPGCQPHPLCRTCWECSDKVDRDCWMSGVDPRPGLFGLLKQWLFGE
jgi:hypothetical protein